LVPKLTAGLDHPSRDGVRNTPLQASHIDQASAFGAGLPASGEIVIPFTSPVFDLFLAYWACFHFPNLGGVFADSAITRKLP